MGVFTRLTSSKCSAGQRWNTASPLICLLLVEPPQSAACVFPPAASLPVCFRFRCSAAPWLFAGSFSWQATCPADPEQLWLSRDTAGGNSAGPIGCVLGSFRLRLQIHPPTLPAHRKHSTWWPQVRDVRTEATKGDAGMRFYLCDLACSSFVRARFHTEFVLLLFNPIIVPTLGFVDRPPFTFVFYFIHLCVYIFIIFFGFSFNALNWMLSSLLLSF